MLDDGERYDTAIEAGDTLAEVSGLLLTAARRCSVDPGERVRCDAIAQAAALSQALAVRVLGCTAPGRYEARRLLRDHLRSIERMSPTDRPAMLPALPAC